MQEWFAGCKFTHRIITPTFCVLPNAPLKPMLVFLDKTEEVRRLGMGRLLADLSEKMTHKAENGSDDPTRILVHATHDTGVAALLNTLDVYDDKCAFLPACFRRQSSS